MRNYLDLLGVFEQKLVRAKPGRVLVVGSKVYGEKPDRRARYEHAIGIDMEPGDGVDIVADLEDDVGNLPTAAHIDCCSVLEHVRRPWVFAANLERLLEPGGTLLVAVPWVWRQHAYPNDYWRMTPAALEVIFPQIEWKEVRLAADGKLHHAFRTPSWQTPDGGVALSRSELFAFGVKR